MGLAGQVPYLASFLFFLRGSTDLGSQSRPSLFSTDSLRGAYFTWDACFVFRTRGQGRGNNVDSGGTGSRRPLASYLSTREFWTQWSRAGVLELAAMLGVPVEKVPRTTNHLESHNNHLKGDYFADHSHGGKLPRLDVWVIVLITQVLADFFFRRANSHALAGHWDFLRTIPQARSGSPSVPAPTPPLLALLQPAWPASIPPVGADLHL